jgi:hypothetical protein
MSSKRFPFSAPIKGDLMMAVFWIEVMVANESKYLAAHI